MQFAPVHGLDDDDGSWNGMMLESGMEEMLLWEGMGEGKECGKGERV